MRDRLDPRHLQLQSVVSFKTTYIKSIIYARAVYPTHKPFIGCINSLIPLKSASKETCGIQRMGSRIEKKTPAKLCNASNLESNR
jgi:hypothetical protein